MRIHIETPARPNLATGNRITATRWARLLRGLGHRVTVSHRQQVPSCDLLVALHAGKSASVITDFHRRFRHRLIVLALTGTDLYSNVIHRRTTREALRLATKLVVLQPEGVNAIPPAFRRKGVVILQSATPSKGTPRRHTFQVCVLAHLRAVKDPFRVAYAARLLKPPSRIHVVHFGAAMSEAAARRATAETATNPRYTWLGDRPHWQAKRALASSRLLVLTSRSEGGANVVGEAIVASVPVISSRIPGSVGMLGAEYPGYFPPGDTRALAGLLDHAERDSRFYATLRKATVRKARLFAPARERASWRRLLSELRSTPEEVR